MEKFQHLIQSFCPPYCPVRPRRLSKHKASVLSAKVSKGMLFLTLFVLRLWSYLFCLSQTLRACYLNSWSSLGAKRGSDSSRLRTGEPWLEGRQWEPERKKAGPAATEVVKPQTSCPWAPQGQSQESGTLEKLYLLTLLFYTVRQKLNHHKFAH